MAKRKTSSARNTLIASAVLLVCMSLPWACELDTSPRILRRPPVERDDADSGDDSR